MGIFAVWGEDAMYGGMYGMYEYEVIDAKDETEATIYARTLSEGVICSYPAIEDELEEQIKEICEEEDIEYGEGTIEEGNIRTNIYDMDLDYGCVELDISKLPTFNLTELTNMFYNEGELFINVYKLSK